MKKIFLSLLVLFSLVGCGMDTPSKSVEQYLSGYNNLIEDILTDIETTVLSENINEDNKNLYRDILKRQYKDLKYEIKDEEINGDDAVVKVTVSVYDYNKVDKDAFEYMNSHMNEFNDETNNFSNDMYYKYKFDLMNKTSDKFDYDLVFKLHKTNDMWVLEQPDRETLEKLNGFYKYEND